MSKIRKFTMLFSLGLLVVLFLTACDTKTIKHIDYKVYFEGANLTPVEVMQGKLLDKPVDPTKEGFKFVGWYSDSEFGTRFDFDITPIENNMTLYAKWEPLPYVKTDEDLVLEAKNDLSLGNVHNVTSNMVLPLQGINGTNITWSSNNKDHLKDDGTIIRPEYQLGNVVVDLTATITLNDAVTTKTFSVTILKTIQERFTVSEVQNLTAQQLVTVEGFVSALSNRRMVIQDENGVGIYIWLSGVKGDLFGEQEIGLGDKVKVFGEFKPGAVNQIDINNTTSGYYVLKLEESQNVVYQTLDYTDMAAFLENDFNDVAGKTYEFKGVKIIQNTLSSSTRRIVFVDQSGLQVAIRVDGNILPDVETGLIAKNIQVGDVYNITTTFYGIDSSTIWSGILSKAEHIEENDEAYLYHALTKLDVFAKTEATADLDFVNQVVIGTKTVNVTYSSSNEAVVTNNGVVTRAVGVDKDVTISVTLTLGSLTIDKEVEIILY